MTLSNGGSIDCMEDNSSSKSYSDFETVDSLNEDVQYSEYDFEEEEEEEEDEMDEYVTSNRNFNIRFYHNVISGMQVMEKKK